MKLPIALLLASTITAHAGSLSEHIQQYNPSLDKEKATVIARELQLYPKVMTYIVRRESSFNPAASSKGCIGLAGVNARVWSKTLKEKKIIRYHRDLWTVKYNLKAGWWIYKHYNKSYRRYRGAK